MRGVLAQMMVIIILSCLSYSCIDEYPLEITAYENLLVVDGSITNAPGPYTVKLSRSTSVSSPRYVPVEDAFIRIEDDLGQEIMLHETEAGIYMTTDSSIQGVPGRSYKLIIMLTGGEIYESPFTKLRQVVGVDSVFSKIESQPTRNPDEDIEGLQFYLNTENTSEDSVYYYWRLQETYEYHAAFTIDYVYVGEIVPFINSDSLFTCYKTNEIPRIYTLSTANNATSRLNNHPLHFVGADSYRLSVRYSLLIKQYNIDEAAYNFWKSVKEQVSDENLLFNSQVYQVRGNVRNVNNPSEPVMGYFTVAGASLKRIFVNKPFHLDVKQPECIAGEDMRWIFYSGPEDWPIFMTSAQGGTRLADEYCFDCRINGGVLKKPDFWIDE